MNEQQLAREKAAFVYSTALERGDLAAVTAVLTQAAQDPALERILLELNEVQQAEMESTLMMTARQPVEKKESLVGGKSWRRYLWPVGGALAALCFLFFVCWPLLGSLGTGQVVEVTRVVTVVETVVVEGEIMQQAFSQTSSRANAGPVAQFTERLIIRNGSLTVVVADPRAVRAQIEARLAEMAGAGAFVVSSSESGRNEALPTVRLSVRVPAAHFDEIMDWLASTAVPGTNPDRSETAQDVTEEYVDLNARLQSLTAARDRLLTIMQNAETTEDLLQAEAQLTGREADIEAIQGRLQYLQQSAALSLIEIQLNPHSLNQPLDTGWNPAATARHALEGLIASVQNAADFLIFLIIALLPWLLVLALAAYLVSRFIWQPWRRRVSGE